MKTKNLLQLITILISVFLVFGTKFIAPPPGLSQSGFMVLGILLSALLLWLMVNLEWTCLFILFALMTIPELGVKTVAAVSFGSTTVVFFITCFILASSLVTTGVAKRIAVWCITSDLSQKGPWMNVFMIFVGVLLLGQGLSAAPVLVICFPILYEIFEMVNYEKGEETPKMLMLGTAIVTQIAMSMSPICHSVVTTGIATFNSYTGNSISLPQYVVVGMPIGLIMFAVFFLICRFVWKPDLSKMRNIDHEAIKAKLGPMNLAEKIAIGAYLLVIICWILPGLTEYFPSIAFMKKVENCYPSIAAIALLCIIKIDGKAILDYNRAVKQDVPWKIIVFMASIQAIAFALAHKKIGFAVWAGKTLAPVFAHISPLVCVMLLIAFAVIVTQFISNNVTLALSYAIGLPLAMTVYYGQINGMVLAILLMGAVNCAFATPPGTHAVALTAASGWVDIKTIAKYGSYAAIGSLLTYYFVGMPLGSLIYGM
jgi:Di- and tricarboxylate transporters